MISGQVRAALQEGWWCAPGQVIKMESGGRGRAVTGIGIPLIGAASEATLEA